MEISCTVDIDDDRCGGESGKVNGHWKFFETFGPDFNSLKFPIRRCQSHRRSANIFLAGNSLFRLFYKIYVTVTFVYIPISEVSSQQESQRRIGIERGLNPFILIASLKV